MIRLLYENDNQALMQYLKQEVITNYFIIIGLERSEYEEMFCKRWGEFNSKNELIAVMLKRKTGNVQFYSRGNYNVEKFAEILRNEEFCKLIGEESILEEFKKFYSFSHEESGPFIAKLENYFEVALNNNNMNIKELRISDIDRVVKLYKKCFKSFATKESMISRLDKGTGRGYYIELKDEMISVVQSSHEDKASAIITGVATHPEYRENGLASSCLVKLITELVNEGKTLCLQYDNSEAGSIYKKMGFYDIGRMAFYYN
jgi:uncharacterized protein